MRTSNPFLQIVLVLILGLNPLGKAWSQSSALKFPSLAAQYPWSEKDLIQPSDLATQLNKVLGKKPLIFNIGVVGNIKGAKSFGAASEAANLEAFKKELSSLPKDASFVYYCGCCPFEKCPNIRPAFSLVKSMGFTNAKLLNLTTNLKTDWIAKSYPLAKQ